MLIATNAPLRHSPDWTVEHEDQDCTIQNAEEFDQENAVF